MRARVFLVVFLDVAGCCPAWRTRRVLIRPRSTEPGWPPRSPSTGHEGSDDDLGTLADLAGLWPAAYEQTPDPMLACGAEGGPRSQAGHHLEAPGRRTDPGLHPAGALPLRRGRPVDLHRARPAARRAAAAPRAVGSGRRPPSSRCGRPSGCRPGPRSSQRLRPFRRPAAASDQPRRAIRARVCRCWPWIVVVAGAVALRHAPSLASRGRSPDGCESARPEPGSVGGGPSTRRRRAHSPSEGG